MGRRWLGSNRSGRMFRTGRQSRLWNRIRRQEARERCGKAFGRRPRI